MGRITRTSATLALLGALALTACGGDDDSSSDTADFEQAAAATIAPAGEATSAPDDATIDASPDEAAPIEAVPIEEDAPAGSTAGSNAPSAPLGLDAYGRAIAVEAGIEIGTSSVRAAVDDTLAIVAANNGSVYSADVNIGTEYDDGSIDGSGRIVVKVPPADLDPLIADLDGRAGVLLGRTQTSDDVTDQLIDLDIRIEIERATITQFEALLADATAFADIVTIQQTISEHTVVLEQLLASQRNTNQRVELSTLTIDVRYLTPEAATVEPAPDDTRGVGDALRSGWDAFTGVIMVAVLALAVALPFLGVALVVLGVLWLIGRRRSSRRTGGPTEPVSAPPTDLSPPTPSTEELVGSSPER